MQRQVLMARNELFLFISQPIWPLLLSQRKSIVTVKVFDPEISIIFDISELPESKYAFSTKYLRVCMYLCVCVYVCYKYVYSIIRDWIFPRR